MQAAAPVKVAPFHGVSRDTWHALQCAGGSEKKIKIICADMPDSPVAFTPARELYIKKAGNISVQTKPFFPGYVLLNFRRVLNFREAMQIVRQLRLIDGTGGAIRMAGMNLNEGATGDDLVMPVAQHEIDFLLDLTAEGEVIRPSKVVRENEEIRIISGPLRGLEGIVKKFEARKNRIKIAVEFLGETRLIELSALDVTPVSL